MPTDDLDTDDSNHYPNWDKLATKGDVIIAMVYQRGLILSLRTALSKLVTDDQKGALEALMEDWPLEWKRLEGALDMIAGRRDDLPND